MPRNYEYRDARQTDRLVQDDPFAALRWPAKADTEPDPFTEAERDQLVAYFDQKNPHYAALVRTMFFTGLRTGEAVGLRWGDVDLRAGKLTVRRSRTMGEDNLPKTKRSRRTITLLPPVVQALRTAKPLHVTDESFVFTTQIGTSLDEEAFVQKHWHRALRATGVRPRKFYATRHTFISAALTNGVNLMWLARYCGTLVEMIERHYGRYMDSAVRPFRRTACRRYIPPPPAARSLARRAAPRQGAEVGTTSRLRPSPTKSRGATEPEAAELFFHVPNCAS